MKRSLLFIIVLLAPSIALAGHTRPGYVDGCKSVDGRYIVTAEPNKGPPGKEGWKFTWKDAKTGETHNGPLVGVPEGLDHFHVAYTHIFVPPGGQTFAVFQPASWAPCDRKPPGGGDKELNENPPEAFKHYAGFADRLVIYRKTGEVLKRFAMHDLLLPNEWIYVNWVQGNLYWLSEYPEVIKNGEPPRSGYRYYQVSPDYSVLEFTVGPNADATHRLKEKGPAVVNYRRKVWVSLVDGKLLDPTVKPTEVDRIPVRPFVGPLVKRGDQQKQYVPSLDPVRTAGTFLAADPTSGKE